jgi:hypothetical protein
MTRALRLPAIGLLVLLLAGCFVSTAPLIEAGGADQRLAGKSRYEFFRSKDGGKTWDKDQDGTIAAVDGGYELDGDPDSRFVMRAAFDMHYIAQQRSTDGFQYDLLRIDGDRIYVYGFTCGDEDQRHVQTGLIEDITSEGNELRCRVDGFNDLATVFAERVSAGATPKTFYIVR